MSKPQGKKYRVSIVVEGGKEFFMEGTVFADGKSSVRKFTEIPVDVMIKLIKALEPGLEYLAVAPPPPEEE